MATSRQDKIERFADDLKGSLDGGVDAIDAKNQALKNKFVDFMRSEQDKGDALHDGMQQRISSWVSEIES